MYWCFYVTWNDNFNYICDGTDVQADWRSCTYDRAPNAIDISFGSLTCPSKHWLRDNPIYGYSEKPTNLVAFTTQTISAVFCYVTMPSIYTYRSRIRILILMSFPHINSDFKSQAKILSEIMNNHWLPVIRCCDVSCWFQFVFNFSGVARRRKVGGHKLFSRKSEKRGHSGVKAQVRVLCIGEDL